MKKLFYYLTGIITCVTGIIGIYYLVNPSEIPSMGVLVTVMFECMISGILFIMLEPRPRKTPLQIRHDDRVKTQGLTTLILILVAGVVLLFATSCNSSRKYGCGNGVNKRMTWDKMERHINRP